MRAENHLEPYPLPYGVALKIVYRDFLAYLFNHALKFWDTTALGVDTRGLRGTLLKSNYHIVMPIPNGWDNSQQGFLRDAAVAAGILPFEHANRLSFVSESESSVHFAIGYANAGSWLNSGTIFAVTDAGGSTVDTTIYKCVSSAPELKLEEITASECVQAGSALLDQAAEKLLKTKLRGSKYGLPGVIAAMVHEFERKTVSDKLAIRLQSFSSPLQKRKFDGGTDDSVIAFGQTYDNDRERNIQMGRLRLKRYAP